MFRNRDRERRRETKKEKSSYKLYIFLMIDRLQDRVFCTRKLGDVISLLHRVY